MGTKQPACTFAEIRIGTLYLDQSGEICQKVSDSTARDSWCAPGFCFEVRPDSYARPWQPGEPVTH